MVIWDKLRMRSKDPDTRRHVIEGLTITDDPRAIELLKEALAQVRRIARGLAPLDLGDEGIAIALQRLAEDTREACGARCVLRVHDDFLPPYPK